MPDLDHIGQFHCKTFESFQTTVRGRSGTHTVRFDETGHENSHVKCDWSCSCPSYRFQRGVTAQGYCKHIRRVVASGARCGWSEFVHGGEVGRRDDGTPCCPKCGGDVSAARWAV